MRGTILGAGDMGTALLTPLHAGGHELRLWGTERDAAIIAALHRGDPHPRLGIPIPPGVSTFDDAEVAAALDGAEIVVVAITSNAIRLRNRSHRRCPRRATGHGRRRQRVRLRPEW